MISGLFVVVMILYVWRRDGATSSLIYGLGLLALFYASNHGVPFWAVLPMCFWLGFIVHGARVDKTGP